MSRPDLTPYAVAERTEIRDLLATLTPDQWSAPSLCAEWTVRDVAAHHLSYDVLSLPQLVATMARGLTPDGANRIALARLSDLGPDDVVDLYSRHLRPAGLTSMFKGGIALTDGTIHHQDIRRALALPREIPAERLVHVLEIALFAPTLPGRGNARGLRLVATDLDWSHGSGPEVTGPGEALLMAVAGRPDALSDLAGDGVDTLAARVRPGG